MPEIVQLPPVQQANLEADPLILLQALEDTKALTLLRETFEHYEGWRNQNHDARWRIHDYLNTGYLPPRMWEGTQVPRAAVPESIICDQIESALPAVMQALFEDPKWFTVSPHETASLIRTPEEAETFGSLSESRQIEARLRYILAQPNPRNFTKFTAEVEQAVKSTLLYGNGGLILEWDEKIEGPRPRFFNLLDLYWDPATPSPAIDDARSVCLRQLVPLEEIETWRGRPGVKLPDKNTLFTLAAGTPFSNADRAKSNASTQSGGLRYSSQHHWLPNPSDRMIEVIYYYSPTRIIWALNRQIIVYNERNPYGFIPLCFAPCYPVLGRFAAQSIADRLEGLQLAIQGLLNLRLDELNLALTPPRVVSRESSMSMRDLKWAPGAINRVTKAKDDVVIPTPGGATVKVFEEIAFLKNSAETRTGISAMAQGVPRGGNINRTLGGVQTQIAGSQLRLLPIVQHIENYLLIPMLHKMVAMMAVHNRGSQPGLNEKGQVVGVDSTKLTVPVSYEIHASSSMLAKTQLQQFFPLVSQYMVNPALVESLNTLGQTVDFTEVFRMLQDATGLATRYQFIRALSEEEKQARNTPPPAEMLKMQQAQMDQQTRLQMGQIKSQTDIQKAQIAYEADVAETEGRDSREIIKAIMAQQADEGRLAIEKEKAQNKILMDRELGEQKLQFQARDHEMKLQQQSEQSQADIAKVLMQLQAERVKTQGQIENQRVQLHAGLQASQAQTQQKLSTNQALGDQKVALAKQQAASMRDTGEGRYRRPRPGRNRAETPKTKK